jgi:hypothetical protein
MDREGVFDHLDFAILIHPGNRTEIYKLSLALIEVDLLFIGKSAHSAACPEKGSMPWMPRSRHLTALILSAANSLAIPVSMALLLKGGKAPNIIPDRARAAVRDFLQKTGGKCHVELIMKDISTVRRKPHRLWGMGARRHGRSGGIRAMKQVFVLE